MAFILCSGNDSLGFVKHDIFHSPVADRLTVKGHLVGFRVNLSLCFLLRHTIYLNTAFFRRVLDLGSAAFVHLDQILVESY